MFQVRHIYEHNMGVIDDDFVKKVPEYDSMIGRRYLLNIEELSIFINSMSELGDIMKKYYKNLE